MKSHATCSARSAAVRRGKSFSTLKKQDDQIAATNVNQSHLIKLERIKLLEAKEKAKLELPHLYGQKFYPWSREFFESTHPMVLMTKGNQVGGSSVQIRKMIHWATDPDIRKSVFGKDPNEQLLFLYFMPSLNLFAREFHTKWIPQFMPRGVAKDSGRFAWRAEYDEKKLESINFIEFTEANTLCVTLSYGSDPHKSMQSQSPDMVFADEEMPQHIFAEIRARLSAQPHGKFSMTCTPTRGEKLWDEAFNGDKFPDAYKMRVSQYDCIKFEDGSPGVHTVERIKQFEQALPSKRDVDVRVHGKFSKLEGLVYSSYDRKDNAVPLKIESPYYYAGIDYGAGGPTGHPSAIVIVAVSSHFKTAKLYKYWKGTNAERTTAGDVFVKYQEMIAGINITTAYYDFAAADFGTIANREGVPMEKANKSHELGIGMLNTLFKNQMLEIPNTEDNFTMIRELETHKQNAIARHANNHACDALRYALVEVPFDFSNLVLTDGKLPAPKEKKKPATRAELNGWPAEDLFDDLDEQIEFYNQEYEG